MICDCCGKFIEDENNKLDDYCDRCMKNEIFVCDFCLEFITFHASLIFENGICWCRKC